MSTLKLLLTALGIAAIANQVLPPLIPDTAGANCDTVTECAPVEID